MILSYKDRTMVFDHYQEARVWLEFIFGIEHLGKLQETEQYFYRSVMDEHGAVVAKLIFDTGEEF